jgi:hypothetical protein
VRIKEIGIIPLEEGKGNLNLVTEISNDSGILIQIKEYINVEIRNLSLKFVAIHFN